MDLPLSTDEKNHIESELLRLKWYNLTELYIICECHRLYPPMADQDGLQTVHFSPQLM